MLKKCITFEESILYILQEITGAFMKNCLLHYAAYRNIFPVWALAEYRRRVPLPYEKPSTERRS